MLHAIVGTYLHCKIISWFSEMELLLGVLVWGYFVKFGVCFFGVCLFVCLFVSFFVYLQLYFLLSLVTLGRVIRREAGRFT